MSLFFAEVEQLVQQTVDRYGKIDIAINNAGIAGHSAKTADYPIDDFEKVMQVNTAGVFYGMKAQLPQMVKQGKGVIINTASIAGLKGLPNSIAYTASKHAVVGMTKTTRHGIRKTKYSCKMLFALSLLLRPCSIQIQSKKWRQEFQKN